MATTHTPVPHQAWARLCDFSEATPNAIPPSPKAAMAMLPPSPHSKATAPAPLRSVRAWPQSGREDHDASVGPGCVAHVQIFNRARANGGRRLEFHGSRSSCHTIETPRRPRMLQLASIPWALPTRRPRDFRRARFSSGSDVKPKIGCAEPRCMSSRQAPGVRFGSMVCSRFFDDPV